MIQNQKMIPKINGVTLYKTKIFKIDKKFKELNTNGLLLFSKRDLLEFIGSKQIANISVYFYIEGIQIYFYNQSSRQTDTVNYSKTVDFAIIRKNVVDNFFVKRIASFYITCASGSSSSLALEQVELYLSLFEGNLYLNTLYYNASNNNFNWLNGTFRTAFFTLLSNYNETNYIDITNRSVSDNVPVSDNVQEIDITPLNGIIKREKERGEKWKNLRKLFRKKN